MKIDNMSLSRQALATLEKNGVRLVIICAGARNAPIVKSLDHFSNFEVLYFFDERAAGFFALGRSKATGEPAAVITTSGTAVAELLPAVVEARYSQVPLVVISADRPKNFRGRGAPQSIEQVGIFSHYVEAVNQCDWDDSDSREFKISLLAPSHLNICFSEPLFATEAPPTTVVASDFSSSRQPLVILGEIPAKYRHECEAFLSQLQAPIYAEAHSGLKGSHILRDLILFSGDRFLASTEFQSQFDSMIRIGSVPTTRLWRDLEDKLAGWGVLSICDNPMSGLGREADNALSFQTFFAEKKAEVLNQFSSAKNTRVLANDRQATERLEAALETYQTSEPGFVRQLSIHLQEGARVFVGNSLPIREWDLAAASQKFEVAGNRGVNGIDGLVSTFLGWARKDQENILLVGDLSALYDLSALWADSQRLTPPVKIVVINNSGGQIFNRMFKDSRFINQHELEFSKWAEMFGLEYRLIEPRSTSADWKQLATKSNRSVIFELRPDASSTHEFWLEYESIFS